MAAHDGNTNDVSKPRLPALPEYGPNAIEVNDVSFAFDQDKSHRTILRDLSLSLPTASRCLLIGANGSGKSTFLRILAGRHLANPDRDVRVLGLNAFRDTKLNFHRAYLDCDWGMRTVAFEGGGVPLMADIPIHKMMEKLQRSYPRRRDELVHMLNIDLNWRMHQLSDGQRRRVQLLIGLIRPFKVLLLDEITTSLDVCVRQDLLRWLMRESEENRATIVYATHIFDGMDEWPTHLYHLTDDGACGWQGRLEDLELYQRLREETNHKAILLTIADLWLRKELNKKRAEKKFESAQGDLAYGLDPTSRQGGYASGRNILMSAEAHDNDNTDYPQMERKSRLSDVFGNRGVMSKHS